MTCDQCGAAADCRALFDVMLAREFSREQPWGRLHGLTVTVTALQHPEWPDWRAGLDGYWTSLHVYVIHGLDSAERMWSTARGHGLPELADVPPLGQPAPPYPVTIADVAGPGGDFPADGHEQRVDGWARATYDARSAVPR